MSHERLVHVAPRTAGLAMVADGDTLRRPPRTMATATYRIFDPLLPRAQAEQMSYTEP